jgi:hypothetical protein
MVASNQYIKNIITAFRRAAEANRTTPGRVGNVITLSPDLADEVMVAGDLHGHRRNFNRLKKIAALDRHPRRHLVLQEVCHGGPVYQQNGGCMSHAMLEDVARLKVKHPAQLHFILGNHEWAEITDYPIQKNKAMLNLLFQLGLQQMYGAAADRIREAFVPFLLACPFAVRLPYGVFISHSIPEFCDARRFDTSIFEREIPASEYFEPTGVFQLIWGRDYRPQNARAFADLVGAKVLINGHEPCYEGFTAPNETQIILDCCSDKAGYVVLPTNRELSHEEIMERVCVLT